MEDGLFAAGARAAHGARAAMLATPLVFALTACSWLAPVPRVDDQGYFPVPKPAPVEQTTPAFAARDGASCRQATAAANDPACFADGLGLAMSRVELRRRELLDSAREVINLQSSYNTLVFPFGAAAVYEKLRGAPNRNLLLPAVIGTAVYGLLQAGIPERDKLYVRASGELLCSLAWHGQWLYLDSEVAGPAGAGTETRTDTVKVTKDDSTVRLVITSRETIERNPDSLFAVAEALSTALDAFQSKAAGLALTPRPGSGAAPGALERVRWGDGTPGKSTVDQVMTRIDLQADIAAITLTDLRRLRGDIRAASLRLSQDTDAIRADLQQRLADKLPALKSPQDVAKALSDPNKGLATAQAGNSNNRDMAPVGGPALLAGLSDASRKELRDFAGQQGQVLSKAWRHAQLWLDLQTARREQAVLAMKGLPCADGTLERAVQPLRKAADKGSADKGTAGNEGQAQKNGSQSQPLSPKS